MWSLLLVNGGAYNPWREEGTGRSTDNLNLNGAAAVENQSDYHVTWAPSHVNGT